MAAASTTRPIEEPFERAVRPLLAGHQREIGERIGRQADAGDVGGQQIEAEEDADPDRGGRGGDQRREMRPAEADDEDGEGAR